MVISDAVQTLERELREVFGSRLQSLVVYGQRAQATATHEHSHTRCTRSRRAATHTLAIVEP
jgi:hypothetical protein